MDRQTLFKPSQSFLKSWNQSQFLTYVFFNIPTHPTEYERPSYVHHPSSQREVDISVISITKPGYQVFKMQIDHLTQFPTSLFQRLQMYLLFLTLMQNSFAQISQVFFKQARLTFLAQYLPGSNNFTVPLCLLFHKHCLFQITSW